MRKVAAAVPAVCVTWMVYVSVPVELVFVSASPDFPQSLSRFTSVPRVVLY